MTRGRRRASVPWRLAWCAALAAAAVQPSQAGVLRYCDAPAPISAAQQDRLLRFGAVIKAELERSGQPMALIARTGLDLGRFGQRYSHAGISLRASPNAPWSVRQLYYDCDQARPRIFDQGIAGFLLGAADPELGYVSVLLLPQALAAPLLAMAMDNRQTLRLLGTTYSANAYPFAPRYQNCNQWVAEMLALAWGGERQAVGAAAHAADPGAAEGSGEARVEAHGEYLTVRVQAQAWLKSQGFAPTRFDVGNPLLMWLGGQLPWLHSDDHPPQDLAARRFHVSMPASIEAFVRQRAPDVRRIEFCRSATQVVVRHGWEPIAEGCQAGAQDTVVAFD